MESSADFTNDVAIDVASDVPGDISTTAPFVDGPNSAWTTKLGLISTQH